MWHQCGFSARVMAIVSGDINLVELIALEPFCPCSHPGSDLSFLLSFYAMLAYICHSCFFPSQFIITTVIVMSIRPLRLNLATIHESGSHCVPNLSGVPLPFLPTTMVSNSLSTHYWSLKCQHIPRLSFVLWWATDSLMIYMMGSVWVKGPHSLDLCILYYYLIYSPLLTSTLLLFSN